MSVMTDSQTDFERSLLVQYEQSIERAFLVQGEALKGILENKLWKFDYDSFDHYCLTRWKIKSAYAYRLIRAYDLFSSTNCRLNRESHYLALDKASPLGIEITAKLIQTLEGNKITAKDIQQLVVIVESAILTGAIEITEGQQIPVNQLAGLEATTLTELIERKRRQWEHMNAARKPIAQFSRGIALDYIPAQFRGVLNLDSDTVIEAVDIFKTASGFTIRGVIKNG